VFPAFSLLLGETNRFETFEKKKKASNLCPCMPRLSDVTIVIVEDHDDTRSFLAEFLTRQGATVHACPDATNGLQAVGEHRPDVVLSDISLPGKNGFELLKDIRGLGSTEGGDVPVISMTAFAWQLNRDRSVAAGFHTHLQKPFGPGQLLEAILSALGKGRARI
jgi:CheY-like chemotaxis protein